MIFPKSKFSPGLKILIKMDVTSARQSNEAQQATRSLCQGDWNKQQLRILISQSVTRSFQLSTPVLSLILTTQFEIVFPFYLFQQSYSHQCRLRSLPGASCLTFCPGTPSAISSVPSLVPPGSTRAPVPQSRCALNVKEPGTRRQLAPTPFTRG